MYYETHYDYAWYLFCNGYRLSTNNSCYGSVQEVTVKSGDTLWDIASRSTASNVDVREVVHTVKELNNISDSGNLTPGTKIKVPVYKTDSPTRAMDYMAQN